MWFITSNEIFNKNLKTIILWHIFNRIFNFISNIIDRYYDVRKWQIQFFLDNDIYDIISSHYSQKSIQNKIYRINAIIIPFSRTKTRFEMKHTWHIPIKIIKSQFFHPKSHRYYHSSQNTRHLNRKKNIHSSFIFHSLQFKVIDQLPRKKIYIYKKRETEKILASYQNRTDQCGDIASETFDWYIEKLDHNETDREREREKNSDMEANDLNYIDRSADSCITSVVGRHTPLR